MSVEMSANCSNNVLGSGQLQYIEAYRLERALVNEYIEEANTRGPSIIVFNCNCCQYSRLAEFDEVLVRGPRWQAPDIQVGLTQLLCSSLAAVVGAWAGRSHGMRGWSIGLLGTNEKREEKLKIKTQQVTPICRTSVESSGWS